ncbi:MAG TPA: acetyl-CoA carboxylase biotin carboxylase subunit [Nitrospinota bacterium]|nr:acetyl-CoA carboxylase biotin carboxylase subunit [Nitrospinota bacterium]
MFSKILVANRGEIALRVLRACKEMGIMTVAVHSDADADSLHVKFADESVCIGPPETINSYLNITNIISAAEITGADAIHPGYGLLAENPGFAEACEASNIKFIGPSPESIRLMGDKAMARETMKKAGIPIIPGSDSKIENPEEVLKLAEKMGFPIIIKASMGGGGNGMKIVDDGENLTKYFLMAKTEAYKAFGSSEVYIEKYLKRPKHIEFQVLGDEDGNVVYLGERDCSIQRRHQKLIEESPSPIMTAKLRKEMGRIAVKAAKSVNYFGAGTVEFLVDQEKNYYFLEMNTRIQVEHPVTEMITGIDLVKEQIKIAMGKPFGFTQKGIKFQGHSIECRINAEDPKKFVPSPGKITGLNLPGGNGVRVDTAIYPGYYVLPFYDSLIAKLIVHGRDRAEALAKMRVALEQFKVDGIKTTIPFHQKVFEDKDFIRGDFCTDFIEKPEVASSLK